MGLSLWALLKESSPSMHHVFPWCPAHHFIVLLRATFIVPEYTAHDWNQVSRKRNSGWVDCLVVWPTPLKPDDQEKHANTQGEMQMGAALADGGRRFDEKAWEQYCEAAAIA